MKKLLLGTLVLLAFSAALIITQLSCKKEAMAEGPGFAQPLNKFLFTKDFRGKSSEIWVSNNDGTGQTKVNITLPAGQLVAPQARLTVDGKGVLFVAMDNNENTIGVYYCLLDGSGLKKVADAPGIDNSGITLQGTY